jgi:hypothetical protein
MDRVAPQIFLLVSTVVVCKLSPSGKTGPFPQQISEVASTGLHHDYRRAA